MTCQGKNVILYSRESRTNYYWNKLNEVVIVHTWLAIEMPVMVRKRKRYSIAFGDRVGMFVYFLNYYVLLMLCYRLSVCILSNGIV